MLTFLLSEILNHRFYGKVPKKRKEKVSNGVGNKGKENEPVMNKNKKMFRKRNRRRSNRIWGV